MLVASIFGQAAHPCYVLFAWIVAGAYTLVPNYAIAIAILTLVVMVAVFPLALRGRRRMMRTQALAPEIDEVRARYKVRSDMTSTERRDLRRRQGEELLALYKQRHVSPTAGLLPFLLQVPVFVVLYGTIRGLVHTSAGKAVPLYIARPSRLFHGIVSAGGQLKAFHINLADSMRSPHLPWAARLALMALVLVAVALQYLQMTQLERHNRVATPANRQLQRVQKVFPIGLGLVYLSIPGALSIYVIVSSICRIVQQELMHRYDPHLRHTVDSIPGEDTGLIGAGGP